MSAPISLISGLPGSGKTLLTIQEAEELHQETGRPVFYYNIPGITLDHWQEIENPELWYELPTGSIIVMDEAQRVFRQRVKGDPPEHVTRAETIRHQGMTMYLMTQHPRSIDVELRRRIGRHIHLHRIFGLERSRKFEWQEVMEDPRDGRVKSKAIGSEFKFPKEVYEWYKSADMHTIQKKLPYKKLAMFAILPILTILSFYMGYRAFFVDEEQITPQASPQPVEQAPGHTQVSISQSDIEAMEWARQFHERIKGQPHSPKFYDEVLKPKAMPKIAGCAEIKSKTYYRCWCNTQQGTVHTTLTQAECRHYLKFGWFDPTKPDEEKKERRDGNKNQPRGINPFDNNQQQIAEKGGKGEGA